MSVDVHVYGSGVVHCDVYVGIVACMVMVMCIGMVMLMCMCPFRIRVYG